MRTFIDLVASMREAQKKYRDSHQLDDLKARGRWERAVDTSIADHLKLYDTPIDEEWLKRNAFVPHISFWQKAFPGKWTIRIRPGEYCWKLSAECGTRVIDTEVFNAGELQDALLAIGLSLPIY